MSDNSIVCEDCMSRANEAQWRERAVTAEMELKQYIRDVQRQHEQLSVLARERDDLQLQVRDTQIRNDVLKNRLERLLHEIHDSLCTNEGGAVGCIPDVHEPCYDCWRGWLEQEVQA